MPEPELQERSGCLSVAGLLALVALGFGAAFLFAWAEPSAGLPPNPFLADHPSTWSVFAKRSLYVVVLGTVVGLALAGSAALVSRRLGMRAVALIGVLAGLAVAISLALQVSARRDEILTAPTCSALELRTAADRLRSTSIGMRRAAALRIVACDLTDDLTLPTARSTLGRPDWIERDVDRDVHHYRLIDVVFDRPSGRAVEAFVASPSARPQP